MKRKYKIKEAGTVILALWAVFLVVFNKPSEAAEDRLYREVEKQLVSIDMVLSQEKVLRNGDGTVSVALTMTGLQGEGVMKKPAPPVDLAVVIDRSGSMHGRKIEDVRQAILQLITRMTPQDRMAIISYANNARLDAPLFYVDQRNGEKLQNVVQRITPGGGTNLSSGLQYGIETFFYSPEAGRQRKVILLSDGLANQGITSPYGLGHMAGQSLQHNFTISTVGVGYDFNETVMTTIADHGLGNYYFLENPAAFANIFQKELEAAKQVLATSVEIHIPVQPGVRLIDAGGYPIDTREGSLIVRPGNILSGQQRKIYLTYKLDTADEQTYDLEKIDLRYTNNERKYSLHSDEKLQVSTVADENVVVSSINKDVWEEKVVTRDYNALKSDVARAVRQGNEDEALEKIEQYTKKASRLNATLSSEKVQDNLERDVQELRDSVAQTFVGAPAAVAEKQKVQSKVLQYESYRKLRDKK